MDRLTERRPNERERVRLRREEQTKERMRFLWTLLGVLIVILIVAIVYEVGLGYGAIEPGSRRIEESAGLIGSAVRLL